MESDTLSDSSEEFFLLNPIEEFLDNETDNLIDLFDDMKSRFYYFLGDRSEKLTEFVLDNTFHSSWNEDKTRVPEWFSIDNKQEISVTLSILNRFLATRRWRRNCKPVTTIITEKSWIQFCYEYTI